MDIARALESLIPNAKFKGTMKDNTWEQFEAVEWIDKRRKPTRAEIETAAEALENGDAGTEYVRLRRQAYPPVGDQLDAILKALNQMQLDGVMDMPRPTDAIINKWLAVKKKHPKPE